MGELVKKPYELSIWEDRLVTEKGITYLKEFKIAVLGSDSMTSPMKAREPVLTENVNGEKTLTFSLAYKYFDEYLGERVDNPLIPYLVNERKIKLHYGDKWYDFVIKSKEESSEDDVFTYTARELFVQELSKVGYNLEFSQELNNCQGTVIELGKRIVEETDWEIDEANCDTLQQWIKEPLYIGTFTSIDPNFSVINLTTNEDFTPSTTDTIHIFYSYPTNDIVTDVQFISEVDKGTINWSIDDNNVIKSTNYRFKTEVTYVRSSDGKLTGIQVAGATIAISNTNNYNQGYRLVYGPLTTYDPVMNRTVYVYKAKYGDSEQEIYSYTDADYITSAIVTSFVTNGSSFNIVDGAIQGWDANTRLTSPYSVVQPLNLKTNPPFDGTKNLTSDALTPSIEGLLQIKFNDVAGNKYRNTYFNGGFENYASTIDHVSAGERFVLRYRYKTGNEKVENLQPGEGKIRAVVAGYNKVDENYYGSAESQQNQQASTLSVYEVDTSNIILDFNGVINRSENLIDYGEFDKPNEQEGETDYTVYRVDTVAQIPSTLYCYIDKNDESRTRYVWDSTTKKFIPKPDSYADYWYTVATARKTISNEKMIDPTYKMGIFLYTDDSELIGDDKYVYLQDVQLTRYYTDADGQLVTIGNVPDSVTVKTENFYLKPSAGTLANEISLYGSIEYLARVLGISPSAITQVYNEDCEKISSIQESNSNVFNLLQTLCETFECWLDIRVEHDETGAITLDENFNPIKRIAFKQYAGKDNFAGFKYGLNLQSIQRTFESDEFVTKLIVDPVQSDFSDTGSIEIQRAPSNTSKESYILNFAYYQNQGLIDTATSNEDIHNLNEKLEKINIELQNLSNKEAAAKASLDNVIAQVNVYDSLVSEAQDKAAEARVEFEKVTNMPYDEFATKYNSWEEYQDGQQQPNTEESRAESIKKIELIQNIIGSIYVCDATVNTYAGILTTLEQQRRNLELTCNGAKDISISVTTIKEIPEQSIPASTTVALDDYIEGFAFSLSNTNEQSIVYESGYNVNTFEVQSDHAYRYFGVTKIPNNYKLIAYRLDQPYEVGGDNALFSIYDTVTEEPSTRRFKLVPTDAFKEVYPGTAVQRDELIQQKKAEEKEFYKKYSRYIQEGTWSSQDYIDNELYYLDALEVSNTSAQPRVEYTINVVEVSEIPGLKSYYFNVGDKTYIEDIEFFGRQKEEVINGNGERLIVDTPIREEVIVAEVEWHLDEPDNNTITVRNYKTRFEDLFQRISAAVQTVQYNEATYAKTSTILDSNGLIKPALLSDSMSGMANGFLLTTNGSVKSTNDGLMFQDLTNAANCVRIVGRGIQISADGGKTWGTALNAEGISADKLTAGSINTHEIYIIDGENPSFRWDSSGLSAFGFDPTGRSEYNLKTYVRFDKYGLYGILDGEDYVASSLNDIKDNAYFGLTWDGFFIKNSYTDGYVSISSDEDFQVVQNGQERIKIGAIEKDSRGNPTKYGINIKNRLGQAVFTTGDDGNIDITGTINATNGEFSGIVTVGDKTAENYIIINGDKNNPIIQSANCGDGVTLGWRIDGYGDAIFSNVSVRGAIKTAVFEYEEIQAVGGAFLFRPSSTIKSVRVGTGQDDTNDLYIEVENSQLFSVGNWVKISNYNGTGDPGISNAGLAHVYKIVDSPDIQVDFDWFDNETDELRLSGAAALLDDVDIESIPGGALIDFGRDNTYEMFVPPQDSDPSELGLYEKVSDNPLTYQLTTDTVVDPQKTYYKNIYEGGRYNYGIGINSSDNYVNLPQRAISLFETKIDPDSPSIKVSYDYKGILGTLPNLPQNMVDSTIYDTYMVGTQGVFTNNMYIGDTDNYLAFYNENGTRKLKIQASEIYFAPGGGGGTPQPIVGAYTTEMYSTLGTQLDGSGEGVVYAVTSQMGEAFDEVAPDLRVVRSEPTENKPSQIILVSLDGNNEVSGITFKKLEGNSYVAPSDPQSNITYDWTILDRDGVPIVSPIISGSGHGQFVYVDAAAVDGHNTYSVQVTIAES